MLAVARALSRRKQGFESPRERQYFQQLRGIKPVGLGAISNFSPMDVASEDRFEVTPEEIGAVTAEPASVLTF